MKYLLQERWQALASRYCDDDELIAEYWREIEALHKEDQRHYHTLKHLECLFRDIDEVSVLSDAIEFSIWYHDAIYKPGSMMNEANSAKLAKKRMRKLGVTKTLVDSVVYMIGCSRKHTNPKRDKEAQLFLDADMAILGSSQLVYAKYLEKVEREFSKIPQILYGKGRIRFIKSTLNRSKIFRSYFFFEKYEKNARINLSMELKNREDQ